MHRALSTILAIALIGVCCCLPNTALGAAVDGKWGIGFEETLTGIADSADDDSALIAIPASGLALHRYIGKWNFEAVVGARAQFASNAPTRWATFLSLGGHFFAFRAPRAKLSAGLRVITGVYRPVDHAAKKTAALQWGFSFELPLRAMFFLSDHFAISGAVGPVAALETQKRNPLTGGKDAIKVNLFKGGFSGGLGFTFLFN